MNNINYDLFGNAIQKDVILRDKFIEPPFSVLDTKTANWQRRKKLWKSLGIKSEVGRNVIGQKQTNQKNTIRINNQKYQEGFYSEPNVNDNLYVSIFDPALCEIIYHWFCKSSGNILDPFAGGSVRGIVANKLGYKYTGIELRQEQVDSNRNQGLDILEIDNQPQWYVGDSNKVLDDFQKEFDLVFSCPPYANLEVYSDLEGDISNMNYENFLSAYESIIRKSCNLLKEGGFACFVVGEVRDKNGDYIGFVSDTINAFKKCGMKYYNEAILLNAIASASMRANGNMKSKKLVKVHQNILIFKK